MHRRLMLVRLVGGLGALFCSKNYSWADSLPLQTSKKPFTPKSVVAGNSLTIDDTLNVVSGKLPLDLLGHFFFVETQRPSSKSNLIAGSGLVSRLSFAGSGSPARILRKPIVTSSNLVAGALDGTGHGFKQSGLAIFSPRLGVVNNANTALTAIGDGRLLLTTDVGIPLELNPLSLEVKTPVGRLEEWQQSLPPGIPGMNTAKMPFPLVRNSAHPVYCPDTGILYTLNHGGRIDMGPVPLGKPFAHLVSWDGSSDLKRWNLVEPDGTPVRIREAAHQMCLTKEFVVIVDTPFHLEVLQLLGLNVSSKQQVDTIVWIIPRASITPEASTLVARQVVLQREWQHLAAEWNSAPGTLELTGAATCTGDFSEWLRLGEKLLDGPVVEDRLSGMIPSSVDIGYYGKISIAVDFANPKTPATVNLKVTTNNETGWFPAIQTYPNEFGIPKSNRDFFWVSYGFDRERVTKRIYNMYADYPYRTIPLKELPAQSIAPSLLQYDGHSNVLRQIWVAPQGWFLSTPQFAPKGGNVDNTKGYILVTCFSDESGDGILVFDSENLAQGPVCQLAHPDLNMSLTLHSVWTPSLPTTLSNYFVPASKDFLPLIDDVKPQVKDAFQNLVFPRFG